MAICCRSSRHPLTGDLRPSLPRLELYPFPSLGHRARQRLGAGSQKIGVSV
jgi:hypothetical protein